MSRRNRLVKPFIAFLALGAIVLAVGGCACVKPGSLALQPAAGHRPGAGPLRPLHRRRRRDLRPVEEAGTTQYLVGIAVPPGSVRPQRSPPHRLGAVPRSSLRATKKSRPSLPPPRRRCRNSSANSNPKLRKKSKNSKNSNGCSAARGPRAAAGLRLPLGPLPREPKAKRRNGRWTPTSAFRARRAAAPSPGPSQPRSPSGPRIMDGTKPANRPVHCLRFEKGGEEPTSSDAACTGALQQAQLGTADLQDRRPDQDGAGVRRRQRATHLPAQVRRSPAGSADLRPERDHVAERRQGQTRLRQLHARPAQPDRAR